MKRLFGIFLLAIFSFSVFAAEQDERLFEEAENRFKNGEYKQALDLYEEIITDFPYSEYVPDAQFRKALGLYRLGQNAEALILLKKVEVKYRSTRFLDYVPFWKGVVSYSLGDYNASIDQLNLFLDTDASSFMEEAYQYLALSQKASGKTAAAIASLEKLLQLDLRTLERGYPATLLCSLYLQTEAYDKCVDYLERADFSLFTETWTPRLELYLAEAYWALGDFERTERTYNSLINEEIDIAAVALTRLFTIYEQNGDQANLDKILLTAEKKLAQKPDILSEFWLRIGIASFDQGKIELAESYFVRAWNNADFKSMSGLVPLYYGEILFMNGNSAGALSIIDEYLSANDDSREFLIYRKIVYFWDMRNFTTLEDLLKEFLKEFPESDKFSECSYLYALSLFELNKLAPAYEAVKSVEKNSRGGAFSAPLLRLKSVLEQKQGDYASAIQSLKKYTPLNPKDAPARMDLVKLYYQAGDYTQVIIETESLHADFPNLMTDFFKQYILTYYLKGLAYVQERSYSPALGSFSVLDKKKFEQTGYNMLYPYYLYYKGWVSYRLGMYGEAQKLFAELVARNDNPFPGKSIYLAGWCAFLNNDYVVSEKYFSYNLEGEDDFSVDRSKFMYAKSLAAQKKYDAAKTVFASIASDVASLFSDDSMFEEAGVLEDMGKISDSAALYRKLYELYPSGSLAEESMYRRGEVLYKNKQYADARAAYRDYRIAYPQGGLVDAALFWGGMAAFENSEQFSAALLWEKIVNEYKTSGFRAEAIYRTADIYKNGGELIKAQELYQLLIKEYPEITESIDAEAELKKILYLQLGQSDREAELSLIIQREGSNSTKKGREALIELSQIYLSNYGDAEKIKSAVTMLESVTAKKAVDGISASAAYYLLGDYYFKQSKINEAEKAFRDSLTLAGTNRDLAARSMYRIAETARLTGNVSLAKQMLDKMEAEFGNVDWVQEAKKILEVE